jgi:hypothetical protein
MKIRAFNSMLMALIAAPVAISSVLLYFAPLDLPGRAIWNTIHIFLGFVLIFQGALHIVMNWRALRSYARAKLRAAIEPRTEGLAALTVFVILIFSAIVYPIVRSDLAGELQTASQTSVSCSSCPYLISYGSCHDGMSYDYDGQTYYGSGETSDSASESSGDYYNYGGYGGSY